MIVPASVRTFTRERAVAGEPLAVTVWRDEHGAYFIGAVHAKGVHVTMEKRSVYFTTINEAFEAGFGVAAALGKHPGLLDAYSDQMLGNADSFS